MIKIAVTGLIASGKSTVAKILAGKKNPVFDSDQQVKKIYKSNLFKQKIKKKLKLKNKKNIKIKIKQQISKNKNFLKELEKIIHPIVRNQIKFFIHKHNKKRIGIFEIPLLIESNLMKDYDKIIFVNSKKNIRLKRYKKRGKIEKFFKILDKRQLPARIKKRHSDYVINNNKSLNFLKKSVKILQNKL